MARNHALQQRQDVLIRGYISFISGEALRRIPETTAENVLSFLSGYSETSSEAPLQ